MGRVVDASMVVEGPFDLALFAGIVGRTLLGAVLWIREVPFRMAGRIAPVIIRGWAAAEGVVLTEGEEEERP